MNKNFLYLFTILECIEKSKIYSNGFNSADEFYENTDQKEYNATLNLLIAIGEEAKKIDENLRSSTRTDWKTIIGLRNIISHDYRGVNRNIIWKILLNNLDDLRTDCMIIFKKIEKDKKEIEEILSTEFYRHIRYLLKEL